MSTRLVDTASRFLAAHSNRRGFLRRAAIVGSAMVTAPVTYLLRPGPAYSALITTCSNCSSGARCCDGYTEFCCSITGVNTCPPGTVVAGWWRAEGTGYCNGSRYYLDCNASSCGDCGCGGSGTCGPECVGCDCGCANDDCDLRKACCTRFRYGQCSQHIDCVGPIHCRVITCVPPWEWDSSCTHTDAVDQGTAGHNAGCLHPELGAIPARPAVVASGGWQLRTTLSGGPALSSFSYGLAGDTPLMADWSGSGVATAAVVRGQRHGPLRTDALTWYIRQIEGAGEPNLVVRYGQPGDIPVVGDWDGDGVATIGVVRGNRWLLRNSNTAGDAELDFVFGEVGDTPVVGDWSGLGYDSVGVVRADRWLLRNTLEPGTADFDFLFGSGRPITGDWEGIGRSRPGRFDQGTWHLRTTLTTGGDDLTFDFGEPEGEPVVWGKLV